MAPVPPPVLSRCRRFGVTSFPEDEFQSGPGGKDGVIWSLKNGVCAYHDRSREYYRLAEGSQLNELCASVDEIAEQLRLMISAAQTQSGDALTDLAAQMTKANADRDKHLKVRDAAVDKNVSDMEARIKALEGNFERISELEKSTRQQLARHDDDLRALDEVMIDRFSGRDQRADEMEVSIKKQFSVANQRLGDITTLLGEAAERISSIEVVTDQKLLELHGSVHSRVEESAVDLLSRIDHKIADFDEAEQTRLTLGSSIGEQLGALKQLMGSKVDAAYVQNIACRADEDRQRLDKAQKGVQLLMSEMVKSRHSIEFLQEKMGGAASPHASYQQHPAPPTGSGPRTGVPPPSVRPLVSLGGKPKWDTAPSDAAHPLRPLRSNMSLPDIRQSPGGSSARR